jgi:hypothetical protein
MSFVEATLIKAKTDDGLWEMKDEIPLGKEYLVDPESIMVLEAIHIPTGQKHARHMIRCDNRAWMPFEMISIKESPTGLPIYPLYHKRCGQIAFYTTVEFAVGDELSVDKIILLDGKHPVEGDLIICGSCNEEISPGPDETEYR